MMISESYRSSIIIIVDKFDQSEFVANSDDLKVFFDSVIFCKTINNAYKKIYYLLIKNKIDNVFLDNDLGIKIFIKNLILKSLSPKTIINIYEEGIGSYRTDMVTSTFKKKLYDLIGVGHHFGSSVFTKYIHVFNKELYIYNFPNKKNKAVTIKNCLSKWIENNFTKLLKIFIPNQNLVLGEGGEVVIYLTNWFIVEKLIMKNFNKTKLMIKPHPHITFDKISTIRKKLDWAQWIPSIIPSEIILIMLSKSYQKVLILHHNSSSVEYVKNIPNITNINIDTEN